MFKDQGILFLYTETPLHPGSGTSVGTVDLPIQRERHTDYPLIQGSGIKGALRDLAYQIEEILKMRKECKQLKVQMESASSEGEKETFAQRLACLEAKLRNGLARLTTAFGPETDRADEHSGSLSFSDARILLFPVRSLQGVFAWATCPFVLRRFQRDLDWLGEKNDWSIPTVIEESKALVTNGSTVQVRDDGVVLEEYHFEAQPNLVVEKIAEYLANTAQIFPQDPAYSYWKERLYDKRDGGIRSNLVILSDNAFRDFARFSTEVLTRIRINEETGVVATGALWSEEHLPSDTLLYSLALATDPRTDHDTIKTAADVLSLLEELLQNDKVQGVAQFGGDETVGRGLVRVSFWKGTKEAKEVTA
jgi:CRISPR-associated protein Cmr4